MEVLLDFFLKYRYLGTVITILLAIVLLLGAANIRKSRKQTNGSSTVPPAEKDGEGWFVKYLWSILIVLFGAAVLYWGFNAKVSSVDVGIWSQDHWFPLFILLSIVAVLIALNVESLGTTTKTVQGVFAGVAFMLLIGFPIWAWIAGGPTSATASSIPQESVQAIPRDVLELPWAWNKDGTQTDTSKWPMVKVPPGGDSVHVPIIPGGHVVWGGSGFEIHCVYADGSEGIDDDEDNPCADGNIVESYVRNEGEIELYASYAYARQSEK